MQLSVSRHHANPVRLSHFGRIMGSEQTEVFVAQPMAAASLSQVERVDAETTNLSEMLK